MSRSYYIATLFLTGLWMLDAYAGNPTIEHWKTANGAHVYFVAAPEIPMLDVRIVFDAGSARDGVSKGLANMTSGLLKEGAGELDADGFSRRLGGEEPSDQARSPPRRSAF